MVDPVVTEMVTAVAAGAVSAFKDDAKDAVKEAFDGLKTLITGKYPTTSASLAQLEEKPTSEGRRTSLAEDLNEAGAYHDIELAERAASLIDVITENDPAVARVIGVELKNLKATNVALRNVVAHGQSATAVSADGVTLSGDFVVDGVTAEETNTKK